MKPYFQQGAIAVYFGDCREVLPALDISSIGAVIADPPYGETSLTWDRWQTDWPDAIAAGVPVSAPLWCFGSMRMFLDRAMQFSQWKIAQDLVWEKHNGSSSAADRFRRVHENVLQWYRGEWDAVWKSPVVTMDATARQVRRKRRPAHWGEIGEHAYESKDGGPRLARSVLQVRSCHGNAVHPTQKPIGIVEPLLRYSVAPGRAALDPFAGSGTTLVVAKSLGMAAIGIEADERWCEAIAGRLSQEIAFPSAEAST
ncbi:MAG: site-specific DNA-methyltransferase [Phenylobacterium sp.]|uniref:DNA-methyltransferase n=1 Tax=Phenylobacterium sp. TaxID=1871053 RepID=UPI001216E636|nr:site-specific DNA-methyltransferase [Phenylobacterium sp.]TAL28988.1 MAG: site-specific DNA-methyltransferase [Phenylobacterium sp.]